MSLREDLYALWKKAENLEAHQRFQEREAQEAIQQRDELLALCRRWKVPTPDATCRECDAPMSMRKWSEQFCHNCRGE